MKALLGSTVIAEAPQSELISIDGNWYFPPQSVAAGVLEPSPTPYRCSWKGDCQYFSVRDGDDLKLNLAWSYPEPLPASFDIVGQDYSGFVAFGRGVTFVE